MNNKFYVFPKIDIDNFEIEDDFEGSLISLVSINDLSLVLLFPINEDTMDLVNFILSEEKDVENIDYYMDKLNVYQTMIDSWKSSDRFLSGIILDLEFNTKTEEDFLNVKLIISDSSGDVDSVVDASFESAILLSSIEKKEIFVTNKLLNKLLPKNDHLNENYDDEVLNDLENNEGVSDPQIVDIAKQIISGKIKDD
jgi:hypothetical protein